MKNRVFKVFCGALMVALAGVVQAADIPEAVTQQLNNLLPGRAPDGLQATPLPGLYEARFGTSILYISEDGRYLIDGSILDLQQRTNLTEATFPR